MSTTTTMVQTDVAPTDITSSNLVASTDAQSNDVEAKLNFLFVEPPNGEQAYVYSHGRPGGGHPRNFELRGEQMIIHDVRGKEDSFTLDKSGFSFVNHHSEETDFLDEELIKSRYYKEVEEMLKKETNASRVVIFDHTIRRNYNINQADNDVYRRPSRRVHVDQTAASTALRVRRHLGDDAETLLKGRHQIINIWRPIQNPVAHYPLAVVDFETIDSERDLVDVSLIRPEGGTSFFLVRHNPSHRWYFLNKQSPDEVLLIKNYDSDPTKATLTAHSAFDQPSAPELPERQSIEVRALVFY